MIECNWYWVRTIKLRMALGWWNREKIWQSRFRTFLGGGDKRKNVLNEPMFPNLRKVVHIVLALPHSSAAAERVFFSG